MPSGENFIQRGGGSKEKSQISRYLLPAFRRRIWLPFSTAAGFALLAFWLIPEPRPRFFSETFLRVSAAVPFHSSTLTGFLDASGGPDVETHAWLLQSRIVVERAAARLARQGHLELQLQASQHQPGVLAKRFSEVIDLEVERRPHSQILMVRATAGREELALQATTLIAEEAVRYSLELKRRDIEKAISILRRRIEQTRASLQDSIRAAEELKASHRALSDTRPAELGRRLAQLNARIEEVDRSLAGLRRFSQLGFANEERWKPGTSQIPETARLEGELAQLAEKLRQLRAEFSGESARPPDLRRLEQNLELQRVEEELAGKANSLEALYRSRRNELAAERNSLLSLSRELESLPELAQRLEIYNQEIVLQSFVIKQLTRRLEEALLDRNGPLSELVVVQEAVEAVPVWRLSRAGWSLAALVLGSFCGGFVAFLLGKREIESGYRRRLQRSLRLPVLGTLPELPASQVLEAMPEGWRASLSGSELEDFCSLVVHFAPESEPSLPFRLLADRFLKLAREKKIRSVLITSAVSGEGATLVSVNLALTLARRGLRVLLVDSDLRRPRLHRVFGVARFPGFADQLLGVCDWKGAVQSLEHFSSGRLGREIASLTPGLEHLSLLAAGSRVDRAAEALGREGLKALLERWRNEFDLVVFDAPPLSPVPDASVLAPLVDTTLLVHRIERAEPAMMLRLKARLEGLGVSIGGLILNESLSRGVSRAEKEQLWSSYQAEDERPGSSAPLPARQADSGEGRPHKTAPRFSATMPEAPFGPTRQGRQSGAQKGIREQQWRKHLQEIMSLTDES